MSTTQAPADGPFSLPPLPWDKGALEPYTSARTVEFHYGKHHAAYVTGLNGLVKGTDMEKRSLEELIRLSAKDDSKTGIFNNAGQVWNHNFFWLCMKPGGGGPPPHGELADAIARAFGSHEEFASQFKSAALTQFGSGWAWLVLDGHDLKVVKTANGANPLIADQVPLLTVDVWEHAFYLDHQNRRADFVQAFLDHLINWDFVQENFKAKRPTRL